MIDLLLCHVIEDVRIIVGGKQYNFKTIIDHYHLNFTVLVMYEIITFFGAPANLSYSDQFEMMKSIGEH